MEWQLNEVREQVETKEAEIQNITQSIEHLKKELEKAQEENQSLQVLNEQSNRKLQLSEAKLTEAQEKLDAQIVTTEALRGENASKLLEVKVCKVFLSNIFLIKYYRLHKTREEYAIL